MHWAPGDGNINLANSTYDYWTANGYVSDSNTDLNNPPTASLPIKNTPVLTAKTQILPAAGRRYPDGTVMHQGSWQYHWASTPADSTMGYISEFCNRYIMPAAVWYTYDFASSIRCVRP